MQLRKETKYVPRAERNEKGILNVISLSKLGRVGKTSKPANLSDVLEYLQVARNNRRISVIDEFFCLYALRPAIDGGNVALRDKLLKSSSALNSLDVQNKLLDEDKLQYKKCSEYLKSLQSVINEKKATVECKSLEQQRIKRETDLERNVLQAGLDIDHVIYTTPELDESDRILALAWAGISNCDPKKGLKGIDRRSHFDLGKMLSARAAEKAAMEFYKSAGQDVVDVSIKQITEKCEQDWKYCDLIINGKYVDVKNTRIIDEERYVDHHVRAFKVRNDQNVLILGVISKYLQAQYLLESNTYHQETSITILGESSVQTQEGLRAEFNASHFHIDFSRPDCGSSVFLPAWVYNFPAYLYRNRDRAIAEYRQQGIPDYNNGTRFEIIPACIAAGINISEQWPEKAFEKWQWAFIKELLVRIGKYGLSLPMLYLSLLSHFIKMALEQSDEKSTYTPDYYRRFIYMNGLWHNPLGICDPVRTIESLINALCILWSGQREIVRNIKYYRLSGFQILQGKLKADDEKLLTLVAYCGGWNKKKNIKCGKTPLVFGPAKHCEVCGKLICPDCGFCSIQCNPTAGEFDDIF